MKTRILVLPVLALGVSLTGCACFRAAPLKPGVQAPGGAAVAPVHATLGPLFQDILFKFDSVEPLAPVPWPEGEPLVPFLLVEGHADVRGPDAYNQKLSLARAKAVADALVAAGLSPEMLQVSGKGESEPLCTDDTEACHQRNRRVIISAVKEDHHANGQ